MTSKPPLPPETYHRQADIVSHDKLAQRQVTIIGAGGIGSPTTLALAKMGVERLTVWDADKVEQHNLPSQFYRVSELEQLKVDALARTVRDYTGMELVPVRELFTKDKRSELSDVVVSGVDSMASRREVWAAVRYNPRITLYVDARMGAEVARVLTVNPCDPDDVKQYEETLYDDKDAAKEKCTAKAIIYNTLSIAGLVANQVKKHVNGEDVVGDITFDLKTLTLLI